MPRRLRFLRPFALSVTLGIAFGTSVLGGCRPAQEAPTQVKIVRYDVQGMHCDGCVNAITAKVLKVKGVASCEVSLEQHLATIGMSDPNQTGEVEAAITKLGYTVGPASGESAGSPAGGEAASPKTTG